MTGPIPTPGSTPTGGPPAAVTQRWAAALAAEHAAVFGYGVAGAFLDGRAASQARSAETAHRDRRDALLLRLAGAAAAAPAAEPAYALPFPVADRDSALRLAVHLEERTAGFWRAALPVTEGDEREFALGALVDCAVRATRWRGIAGIAPTTDAFPGRTA